jgi:NAD(P)-dependent dehydrogenase (short-subunit alcohol dehydrogenase family)
MRVWFVTGASRGFGRSFVEAALAHGDQVVAAAREVAALDGLATTYGPALAPIQLDVTDRSAVGEAVQHAVDHFGRLDVVVNNAGYGLFGAVEELSEQQLRDQLETNFFGAVWVTQAVLPHMRRQGSGHLVQISSVGGVAAFPLLGGYHASKWALEGLSESLAQEVGGLGIKVTIVEPAPFATDWAGSSAVFTDPNPAYDQARAGIGARRQGVAPGDPTAAGDALLEIVDAENPPLRVFFGTTGLELVPAVYEARLRTWSEWAHVAKRAQG